MIPKRKKDGRYRDGVDKGAMSHLNMVLPSKPAPIKKEICSVSIQKKRQAMLRPVKRKCTCKECLQYNRKHKFI